MPDGVGVYHPGIGPSMNRALVNQRGDVYRKPYCWDGTDIRCDMLGGVKQISAIWKFTWHRNKNPKSPLQVGEIEKKDRS
jgi:hypothetical protein